MISIVDRISKHAAEHSSDVAFIFLAVDGAEAERMTYAALDSDARCIAGGLSRRTQFGQRAILLVENGAPFIRCFVGCLYAGVVAVPTNTPHSTKSAHLNRLLSIVLDADPELIIYEDDYLPVIEKLTQNALLPSHVSCVSVSELLAGTPVEALAALTKQSLAFLQYTSGSTNHPKGVMVTHANLLANEQLIESNFQYSSDTVMVNWLPLYHDMGLIGNILQPLYLGARCISMSPMTFLSRPALWLSTISKYRATTSGAPNSAYQLCVDKITDDQLLGVDLSTWDLAYIGAEPIRAATLRAFATRFARFGFAARALYPCYGLAEATLFVTGATKGAGFSALELSRSHLKSMLAETAPPSSSDIPTSTHASTATVVVSCGSVNKGQMVRIIEPATGVPLQQMRVGEVWVHGPSVASGYWNRSEESLATFGARPADEQRAYLRTGDLGFICGEDLFITGRLKDLIIIRGRNFTPQDIEETAHETTELLKRDGGAAFAADIEGDEQLVLVHELTRSGVRSKDLPRTLAEVRAAIIETHLVSVWDIVLIKPGSLPRTTSGKIQRLRARQLYQSGQFEIVASYRGVQRTLPEVTIPPVAVTSMFVASMEQRLMKMWSEVSGVPFTQTSAHVNFFDQGADSVTLMRFRATLEQQLKAPVRIVDLYDASTIRELAIRLVSSSKAIVEQSLDGVHSSVADHEQLTTAVAIIGFSGRFPDADSPKQFWSNLQAGHCSVRQLTDKELIESGVPTDLLSKANYVKAVVPLKDYELFDADHFRLTPREAELLDPQQRWLLECSVEALELAGYPTEPIGQRVGVFFGKGECVYSHRFVDLLDYRNGIGSSILTLIGSGKAYTATMVSYHLGLTGPSETIDTACSTSLVAVHQGITRILCGECDLALAGAASMPNIFGNIGYLYDEGGILSPDGYCRAFSPDAKGTVFGGGAGVVVLKRLDKAKADGDTIHAIILGSAVNNDGSRKVGFTAPSVAGHVDVIHAALKRANRPASAISYVETHGTGTAIGDALEVEALSRVFESNKNKIPIGSCKTNVGHLEAAAGIAGLLKVVQALQHRQLPPSLHVSKEAAEKKFASTPVRVITELEPWPSERSPRLAGVSSLGIGGTNAHVIVQEAPDHLNYHAGNACDLFVFSASSQDALRAAELRLADYLADRSDTNLSDVAFTLQVGRRSLPRRSFFVAESRNELISKLRAGFALSQEGAPLPSAKPLRFTLCARDWDAQQFAKLCAQFSTLNSIFAQLSAGVGTSNIDRPELRGACAELALAQFLMTLGVAPAEVTSRGWLGELLAACIAGYLDFSSVVAISNQVHLGSLPQGLVQHFGTTPQRSGIPFLSDLLGRPINDRADLMEWADRLSQNVEDTEPSKLSSSIENIQCVSVNLGALTGPAVLAVLGASWTNGAHINFSALHSAPRHRIPLPTYPFQRRRFWIEEKRDGFSDKLMERKSEATDQPQDAKGSLQATSADIEENLLKIVEAVLGVQASPDSNFLEIGGDSLTATQVVSQIRSTYDISLDLYDMLESPTVREIAQIIRLQLDMHALRPTMDAAQMTTEGVVIEEL